MYTNGTSLLRLNGKWLHSVEANGYPIAEREHATICLADNGVDPCIVSWHGSWKAAKSKHKQLEKRLQTAVFVISVDGEDEVPL